MEKQKKWVPLYGLITCRQERIFFSAEHRISKVERRKRGLRDFLYEDKLTISLQILLKLWIIAKNVQAVR